MRFFVKTLIAIVLAALIAGALTYPAWFAVTHFADYRPDRIMRRIGELLLVVALVWILRREGLVNRATFGYGVPRRQFLRQMMLGFVAGLLLMLPLVFGFLGLDIRTWNTEFTLIALAKSLVEGALAGFVIAFIEESLLRGAMYSVIERESGITQAIVMPSVLFAALHFMVDPDAMRVSTDHMNFAVGMQIAVKAFAAFAEPLKIIDALFALFALGVLLALIRRYTGAIAGSIGLHAGGVAMIAVIGQFTSVNSHTSLPWLIGSYNDGVIGWLAFLWITIVALGYWRIAAAVKQN